MFAPGFITGDVIRKVGEPAVMLVGALFMIAHSAIALAGDGRWNFGLALMFSGAYRARRQLPLGGALRLTLLVTGVGWNFMYTAGTALLVAAVPDGLVQEAGALPVKEGAATRPGVPPPAAADASVDAVGAASDAPPVVGLAGTVSAGPQPAAAALPRSEAAMRLRIQVADMAQYRCDYTSDDISRAPDRKPPNWGFAIRRP
jgi:hypothetical protein